MITSFRVGAIFEIQDLATPIVARLAGEMQKLATLTATVRAELQSISSIRIGSVTTRLTALSASLDKGATAAAAMTSSVTAGTAAMDAGLVTALGTARALTTQLAAAGRAGAGMRLGGLGGGGPPRVPGVGGGAAGGGGHGRPFHVGRIGTHLGPMHASVGGTGGAIAAGAGIWGVAEIMKEAQDPLHQEAMLRLQGLDDAQIAQIVQRARLTASEVPGSGFAANIKTMGEMYSIVGLKHALELSQDFAQLDRVMGAVGKTSAEGSGFILSRAGEMMGKLSDPENLADFRHTLQTMGRVGIATHGKVTPEQWLNYVQQAGPAAGTLTDEGMYTTAAIIQVMKGFRAGTAAQALQRQFAGGIMTKSKADELKALEIFKEGDYTVERGGHVQFKRDAAKNFVNLLQKDPLVAITDVLEPAMERHGITTLEDQTKEIYKIIGTGPAQREAYDLLRGHKQIVAERERAKQALPPGQAFGVLQEHDPTQAMAAFTTAFKDMVGALGSPTMLAAVPVLNGLTAMFNSIATWAGGHKKEAAVAGGIAAGAAGGAALGFGIGLVGGPVGAGGGAVVGGALGAAIAFMGTGPDAPKTAYDRRQERLRRQGLLPETDVWGVLPAILPSAAAAPAGGGAGQVTNVKADISVKAETDDPRGLAERLLAEINKLIAQGNLHNQGQGDGVLSSPYAMGIGNP